MKSFWVNIILVQDKHFSFGILQLRQKTVLGVQKIRVAIRSVPTYSEETARAAAECLYY